MQLKKFRWSKVYESSEHELIELFEDRNIEAIRWHAEAFESITDRHSSGDVTLWCAEGSFTLICGEKSISIQVGDAIHIPHDAVYKINAGISGCVCYF